MRFHVPAALVLFAAGCDGGRIDVGPGDTDADTDVAPTGDADQDGHDALDAGGDDCDDADASVFPGSPETRDLVDDDCDGLVDEDFVRPGDVLVTEILAHPIAVSDAYGEYVELVNVSPEPIDLVGWTLAGDDGDAITIGSHLVIEPGVRVVLGASADPSSNGGIAVHYAYDRAGFALSDAADSIFLWCGDTPVFDLGYDASWGLGAGVAAGLDPEFTAYAQARQGDYWCAQTSELPSGDRGTPGGANDWCLGLDHDGDGLSEAGGDCDDADADVYPGAPEHLDGVDEDCDGRVDDIVAEDAGGWLDGGGGYDYLGISGLAAGDVDGDGRAEVVISANGSQSSGRVYTVDAASWASFADPITDHDEWVVTGQTYNGLSNVPPTLGDNHGGPGVDLVIGASDSYAGPAWVLFDGPLTAGAWTPGDASLRFGGYDASNYTYKVRVFSSADVDGDGHAEVIAGSPSTRSGTSYDTRGIVTVFETRALGPGDYDAADADIFLNGDALSTSGGSINGTQAGSAVGGGDLDGDGYDEILVGAQQANKSAGALYVVPGSSAVGPTTGLVEDVATARIDGPSGYGYLGALPPVVDDLDGDGRADLAVSAYYAQRIYVFLDGDAIVGTLAADDAATARIMGGSDTSYLGYALASGDVDGDGAAELAVSAPYGVSPAVYLFHGSDLTPGDHTTVAAAARIAGAKASDYFGYSVLFADLDGDSRDDLVIGAPYAAGYEGRVYFLDL